MRALAVLLLFASACAMASNVPAPVDLDQPGAFEALRTGNPKHYAQVRAIILKAEVLPYAPTAEWLQSNFDARDVFAIPMWQVSNPPRMRLSFRLDDIRYSTTIVQRSNPQLAPIR